MTMDLNDFISNFQGGARANRFSIIITWPSIVGSPNVLDQFVVQAASLPVENVNSIPVPYMGRTIPTPGDRTQDPWTVTVLNDVSFSHRNTLEHWGNLILAHEQNIQGTVNYKDLLSTVTILQKDRNDNVIKTVTLRNCWPSNISEIALDYSTNDQVETFTCTFNYSHIESPSGQLT